LLIGELPPLGGSTSQAVSYWNSLNHDAIIGVANTSLIRNTETAMARFQNDGGPPCPGVAYFGPGDLNNQCSYNHIWSFHTGGANFAFTDGSVRFLPYSASQILIPLATRDGGEVTDPSLY
jgi:prepilin-type processing-associated H-X9-DG protein